MEGTDAGGVLSAVHSSGKTFAVHLTAAEHYPECDIYSWISTVVRTGKSVVGHACGGSAGIDPEYFLGERKIVAKILLFYYIINIR